LLLENFYLNTLIVFLISYIIGAIPAAYIAGRIKGVDIRKVGSKNVGGMNAFSSVGKLAGILVAVFDFGKGALVAFIATLISEHPFIPMLAIVAAMIGHNWNVFIGFKGGKGVSVLIGGILFLSPLSIFFLFFLFFPAAFILLKDTYLANAVGLFYFSFFLWFREGSFWWLVFIIAATVIYSLKCYGLILSYFREGRKDINPLLKRIFKPFFKGYQ